MWSNANFDLNWSLCCYFLKFFIVNIILLTHENIIKLLFSHISPNKHEVPRVSQTREMTQILHHTFQAYEFKVDQKMLI